MSTVSDPVRKIDPRVNGVSDVPRRWGFIGAGKMATALIRGMIRDGTPLDAISASDPNPFGPRGARDRDGDLYARLKP